MHQRVSFYTFFAMQFNVGCFMVNNNKQHRFINISYHNHPHNYFIRILCSNLCNMGVYLNSLEPSLKTLFHTVLKNKNLRRSLLHGALWSSSFPNINPNMALVTQREVTMTSPSLLSTLVQHTSLENCLWRWNLLFTAKTDLKWQEICMICDIT